MDEPIYQALTELTSVGDLTAAHLLAARLESEGITAVVRGEPLGPYPVSVGRMAVTSVLVSESDLEEATALLAAFEDEAADVEVEYSGIGKSSALPTSILWWVVAALLLGWVIWLRLGVLL